MIRPRKPTPRLAVEALEDRCVPAGNVTAQLLPDISGDLTVLSIVGDNEANEIRVVEDAPGHVRIEGLGSTTVNGLAALELFSARDVLTFAEIQLGNGDDSLVHEFTGDQWRHGTRIDTGHGNDSVSVSVRGVVGVLWLDTGTGNDSVTLDLAPATFILSLQLNTGLGDDSLLFRSSSDGGSPTLGHVLNFIEMDQGKDVAQFEGEFGAENRLFLSLGAGDDTLMGDAESSLFGHQVQIFAGHGHDAVFNASYFGDAFADDFETSN